MADTPSATPASLVPCLPKVQLLSRVVPVTRTLLDASNVWLSVVPTS